MVGPPSSIVPFIYAVDMFLQIRDGEKSIFEVLDWYNEIINFFIDYISLSIHDSDISEFYRYILGFKNLLR
jgi:hypothetical protein